MRFYVSDIVCVGHEKFKALDKVCILEISFGDGKNNKFFHKTLNDVGRPITFSRNSVSSRSDKFLVTSMTNLKNLKVAIDTHQSTPFFLEMTISLVVYENLILYQRAIETKHYKGMVMHCTCNCSRQAKGR